MLRIYSLYAATVLIWGSTWIAIKPQVAVVAPETSVTWRYLIAAGILQAWCLGKGLSLRFTPAQHLLIAVLGLCLFCANYILFYFATRWLTSGLLAVVFSTILFMNIANGRLFFATPVEPVVLAGGLLGLAGVTLIFLKEIKGLAPGSAALTGIGFSVLATYSASLGNMASLKLQRMGLSVVRTNTMGMTYGALFCIAWMLLRGTGFQFEVSAAYIGSLLYLALFGSVLAFGSYLSLVGSIGAERAAYATVLFPVIALALSTMFEDYRWSISAIAGFALVILGNVLVLAPGSIRKSRS